MVVIIITAQKVKKTPLTGRAHQPSRFLSRSKRKGGKGQDAGPLLNGDRAARRPNLFFPSACCVHGHGQPWGPRGGRGRPRDPRRQAYDGDDDESEATGCSLTPRQWQWQCGGAQWSRASPRYLCWATSPPWILGAFLVRARAGVLRGISGRSMRAVRCAGVGVGVVCARALQFPACRSGFCWNLERKCSGLALGSRPAPSPDLSLLFS